jgi:hypothetical protein
VVRYLLPRLRSRGVETTVASLYASGLTPAEMRREEKGTVVAFPHEGVDLLVADRNRL